MRRDRVTPRARRTHSSRTLLLGLFVVHVAHPVATARITWTDTSRPTPPLNGYPGSPSRVLPTSLWYPSDRENGPFPLVMFAHGFAVTPDTYSALLSRIAAAGYVVAAPTYPILSGQPAGPSNVVGWDDLYPDTWFVTSQVLDASASGSGPLANLVDPQRIAVAGHSDGASVSFGLGYQPFRLDWRVRAVIAYAADLDGTGFYVANARPILHVLSDQDEYNPFPDALAWDNTYLAHPKTVMTLVNANHLPPYADPNDPHFSTLVTETIAFLASSLKSHPEMLFFSSLAIASTPHIARLEP